MATIAWNQAMSVRVKTLDDQHKKLFETLHVLEEAVASGQSAEVLGKVIERMIDYTRVHFRCEEAILSRSGFPGLAAHCREHDEMISKALSAQARFRWGSAAQLSQEILDFLTHWLTDHIQGTDQMYVEHLEAYGSAGRREGADFVC